MGKPDRFFIGIDDSESVRKIQSAWSYDLDDAKRRMRFAHCFYDCTNMGDDEFEKLIHSTQGGRGGLDVGYPSEESFRDECYLTGYDPSKLIADGEYSINADGSVSASKW